MFLTLTTPSHTLRVSMFVAPLKRFEERRNNVVLLFKGTRRKQVITLRLKEKKVIIMAGMNSNLYEPFIADGQEEDLNHLLEFSIIYSGMFFSLSSLPTVIKF